MFERLTLKNYQSHECTTIEFHPGINVITGPSDNGKSAILRGLEWPVRNKPDGIGFASHWAVNSKGVLLASVESILEFDGGRSVVRRRTKDSNQYVVDGIVLDAVGRDVPPEVLSSLDVTEVNIKDQLDPHFLLSDSAGEVARILNRTIRLDDIDKLLSLVEQKKRATRTSLENATLNIARLEESVQSLDWIDNIEFLLSKCAVLSGTIQECDEAITTLEDSLQEYERLEGVSLRSNVTFVEPFIQESEALGRSLSGVEDHITALQVSLSKYQDACAIIVALEGIADWEKWIDCARDLNSEKRSCDQDINTLSTTLNDFREYERICSDTDGIATIFPLLTEIDAMSKDLLDINKSSESLRSSLHSYQQLDDEILRIVPEIQELVDSLPEDCPLCGTPGALRGRAQ